MNSEVINFISRFTDKGLLPQVEVAFTNGCCYWFAYILFSRFIRDGATIMYSSPDCHFGTRIGGKTYDITGDVTNKYSWEPWENFNDDSEKQRIIRDCLMF